MRATVVGKDRFGLSLGSSKEGKNMAKKFSLLLAALALLAFAVPTMASAAKLTEGGKLVEPGTAILGTGSNVELNSNLLGSIICEKITLKGTVTKNNGTEVEGSGENKEPGTTNCKNGVKPVKVTSVNLKKLFVKSATEATGSFETTIDIGKEPETVIECTFTGENIPGSFVNETDTVSFNTTTFSVKGSAACGNAKLKGSFTLETTNGTPVILDE
jgi:hypothetical protein